LKVLDGANGSLEKAELVILEVQFFQFMRDIPEFADVIAYMKERGFVAYDCFGSAYRPLDGALAAMDIAFVKEKGRWRENHAFATREQRRAMEKIFVRR